MTVGMRMMKQFTKRNKSEKKMKFKSWIVRNNRN